MYKNFENVIKYPLLEVISNIINEHRPANLDYRNKSGNDSREGVFGNDKYWKHLLNTCCQFVNTPHSALSCHSLPHGARECGRSMIEMLGVLAIIGVLSVGGIAGYSKAMSSYKHNKWLQQVENLIFNIKDTYKNQKRYGEKQDIKGESQVADEDILPTLKAIGAVPSDMLDENNLDLFGNRVSVYNRTWNVWTRLEMGFRMLAGDDAVENCMHLFRLPLANPSVWSVRLCKGEGCWGPWIYTICGKSAVSEYLENYAKNCPIATYDLYAVTNACKVCKDVSCTVVAGFDNNV